MKFLGIGFSQTLETSRGGGTYGDISVSLTGSAVLRQPPLKGEVVFSFKTLPQGGGKYSYRLAQLYAFMLLLTKQKRPKPHEDDQ